MERSREPSARDRRAGLLHPAEHFFHAIVGDPLPDRAEVGVAARGDQRIGDTGTAPGHDVHAADLLPASFVSGRSSFITHSATGKPSSGR